MAPRPTPETQLTQNAGGIERSARLLAKRIATAPTAAWIAWILSLSYLLKRLGDADVNTLAVWISSDTLYPVNLFSDLFLDGYAVSGWRFSIAPCWFPDLLLAGMFMAVTRNAILATLLAGFVQMGLLVGALRLCRKAIGIGGSGVQDVFLLATAVGITLYVADHPGVTYPGLYQFFLPQTHVGSMLVVLYALGLGLLMMSPRRPSSQQPRYIFVIYGALCLLGGLSNLLFFVQLLAPLTVSVAIAVFFGLTCIRQSWSPILIGWPSAILGAVLNRVLFNAADVATQAGARPDRILTALDTFMRGLVAHLLAADWLHIVAVVWLLICSAYPLYLLRQLALGGPKAVEQQRPIAFVFFLACLLSAVFSAGAIVGGGSNGLVEFKDYRWSLHYMHQLFLLPLFSLPLVLSWGIHLTLSGRWAHRTAVIVATVAVLLPVYKLTASPGGGWPIQSYTPPLVRFMDDLASREHLRYGYAGYWQARLITLLSKRDLRAYAVDGDIKPFLWANNIQWYSQSLEDRRKRPPVDFVVLDDPFWKISREAAVRALGEPLREERFGDTRVLIYKANR